MSKQSKEDLSTLPLHIHKHNRYFYKNTMTGKFIHKDNIKQFLPKPAVEIPSWHCNYDNY